MREIIATGKSVEEATETGCRELGKSRDEVSVEILEMPVRKLFKTLPAKVKITINETEEKEIPEKIVQEKPAEKVVNVIDNKPEINQNIKQVNSDKTLHKEPEEKINLSENKQASLAANYLKDIFIAMGSSTVEVTAYKQGDATLLKVEGEDLADIIDTRGETVQALSYLTDRSVNRGIDKKEDDYLRIRLDVAGYRNRRESELISLANRTAKDVLKNNRSRTLAPMNPYERLIIHTTISNIENVISESIGSDTERRVVIKSTLPGSKDGGERSSNKPYNKRNSGNRKNYSKKDSNYKTSTPDREYANKKRNNDSAPVVPEQREAIKDGENLPLYGKIEL